MARRTTELTALFEAQSLPGKNLCPPLSKGIRLTDTTGTEYAYANGVVSDKIPVNFSKTPYITVSGFIETVRSCVFAYDKNGVFIGRTANTPKTSQVLSSNSTFLNENGTKEYDKIAYLRIEMYTDNTVTGTIDDIVNAKIQLEIGGNATPYEPYIGTPEHYTIQNCKNGYLSDKEEFALKVVGKTEQNGEPTPDTPIPIQCVPKGSKVKVLGKNAYNRSTASEDTIFQWKNGADYTLVGCLLSDFIPVIKGETYTTSIGNTRWAFYDENKNYIGNLQNDGSVAKQTGTVRATISIPIDLEISFIKICTVGNSSNPYTKDSLIQLELGSTATPYEPYTCQEITTPCDLYEGDVWYPTLGTVIRNSHHIVLTSKGDWSAPNNDSHAVLYHGIQPFPKEQLFNHTQSLLKTNYFTRQQGNWNTLNIGCFNSHQYEEVNWFSINMGLSLDDTKAKIDEWYNSGNPLIVYYQLKEPIIEFYDPQPVYTPQGTVNIMQESTDLLADLQATVLVRR